MYKGLFSIVTLNFCYNLKSWKFWFDFILYNWCLPFLSDVNKSNQKVEIRSFVDSSVKMPVTKMLKHDVISFKAPYFHDTNLKNQIT